MKFYKIGESMSSQQVNCSTSPIMYDPITFTPVRKLMIDIPLELLISLDCTDTHISPSQAKLVLMNKISEKINDVVKEDLPDREHLGYLTRELAKVYTVIADEDEIPYLMDLTNMQDDDLLQVFKTMNADDTIEISDTEN